MPLNKTTGHIVVDLSVRLCCLFFCPQTSVICIRYACTMSYALSDGINIGNFVTLTFEPEGPF